MKPKERKKMVSEQKRIAKERIEILFDEARKAFKEHPERSKRYIEIARKIGMRCNVSFTKEQKMRWCKRCEEYLVPGNNCTVRLDSKKNIIIHCNICNAVNRFGYESSIKNEI